jgi:hypothetical protein
MRLRLAFAPWLAIHPGGSAQSAMRRKGWLSSTERNNILTTGDFLQRIGESDGFRDAELELSDRGLRAIHRYRIEPLSTQSFVEACAGLILRRKVWLLSDYQALATDAMKIWDVT